MDMASKLFTLTFTFTASHACRAPFPPHTRSATASLHLLRPSPAHLIFHRPPPSNPPAPLVRYINTSKLTGGPAGVEQKVLTHPPRRAVQWQRTVACFARGCGTQRGTTVLRPGALRPRSSWMASTHTWLVFPVLRSCQSPIWIWLKYLHFLCTCTLSMVPVDTATQSRMHIHIHGSIVRSAPLHPKAAGARIPTRRLWPRQHGGVTGRLTPRPCAGR